ncbi:Signal transduction histidine kinase [Pseudovibrio ascidiaceicola]|uniref:histidine kinase n=2 Tax=Pseudovibrio ascidiaceicola TaxID=285279 RepID=A0A1I4FMC1_9HYPH|nr:Signal transduction histidine kinase [Pseudovibrio ascidiaceicola]
MKSMRFLARFTLGQQLILLVIGLVMAVQFVNVIVARIADVQFVSASQKSLHLTFAGRSFRGVLALPENQRGRYAQTLSNLAIHVEWGTPRDILDGDKRRPDVEAEALSWYSRAGLPVSEVVVTERGFPTPPPPRGMVANQAPMLGLGEPPRTLLTHELDWTTVPRWVFEEKPTSPESFLDFFRPQPRAEVHRIALRHDATGEWLTVYQLRRFPPVNVAFTNLIISSLISLFIAVIIFLISRRVMRPFWRLSHEAERLGRGESTTSLAVEGPRDTREIIKSFNRMNERVSLAVDYQIGLLRSLAHDLKGPLSGVKRLSKTIKPDTARDQISARLDQVQNTLDSIMTFSRAVMRDGDFQRVDLALLLDVVIEERCELGDAAEMADAAPVIVSCRVNAIQRCLSNLVENACKYGEAAQATVSKDGDEAVITIDDNGPGIPEDELELVFQPFERLATDVPGSGLGLAIVKTIVTDQGGSIRLLNRAEGGLRAELRLPLHRQD